VAPYVSGNDDVMREWNHLNKIISSDPIDYSQIEFYLLLSNKNNSPTPQSGSKGNIGSSNKIADDPNRFRYSDFNAIMDKNNFEKKGSFLASNTNKKYACPHSGKILSRTSKASRSYCSTTRNASKTSIKRKARVSYSPAESTPPPTASPCADTDRMTFNLTNRILFIKGIYHTLINSRTAPSMANL
jgi:hypothetical protein